MAETTPAAAMPATGESTYDAVPYRDYPYSFSHVRHLETMATLFGMTPADITKCRVLELGCAAGGNLIPQATDLPGSTFLGIDLSERQIADGQKLLGELQLPNIELRRANILDIDESWGQFDYIIAHGVFSWVPPMVQEKILDVFGKNLSPQGAALLSYNTYPGWRLASVVRDLMRYHAGQFEDPLKRITQAKAILEYLVALGGETAMAKLFREELDLLKKANSDTYLFHDHMEVDNNPVYFHELIAMAEANGLQYLSETEFSTMLVQNLPEQVRSTFAALPIVQQEQYMDFLRGRRFRTTILCRRAVSLNRTVTPDLMRQFHFAIDGPSEGTDVDIRTAKTAQFRRRGGTLTVSRRLVKAAVAYLREISPRFVAFRDLYLTAFARVQASRPLPPDDPTLSQQSLAESLLQGYAVGMFDVCVHPPRCVHQPGNCPTTTALARLQAAHDLPVTNQYHRSVSISKFASRVILRLDGRHDRAALLPSVREAVAAGDLVIQRQNQAMQDPPATLLDAALEQTLQQLAASSLLVE